MPQLLSINLALPEKVVNVGVTLVDSGARHSCSIMLLNEGGSGDVELTHDSASIQDCPSAQLLSQSRCLEDISDTRQVSDYFLLQDLQK